MVDVAVVVVAEGTVTEAETEQAPEVVRAMRAVVMARWVLGHLSC